MFFKLVYKTKLRALSIFFTDLKAPSVIYLNNDDDSRPEAFVTIKVASHLDLIIQRQTKCSPGPNLYNLFVIELYNIFS